MLHHRPVATLLLLGELAMLLLVFGASAACWAVPRLTRRRRRGPRALGRGWDVPAARSPGTDT